MLWTPTNHDRLGDKYDRLYARTPPGMSAQDAEIWSRYRPVMSPQVINVYYNVRLGFGDETPPGTPDNMLRGWFYNTAKRADVVLEYAERVEIIELRFDANSSAIGRLLQYDLLWKQQPPIDKPTTLILVSDREVLDVAALAAQFGIGYTVA